MQQNIQWSLQRSQVAKWKLSDSWENCADKKCNFKIKNRNKLKIKINYIFRGEKHLDSKRGRELECCFNVASWEEKQPHQTPGYVLQTQGLLHFIINCSAATGQTAVDSKPRSCIEALLTFEGLLIFNGLFNFKYFSWRLFIWKCCFYIHDEGGIVEGLKHILIHF